MGMSCFKFLCIVILWRWLKIKYLMQRVCYGMLEVSVFSGIFTNNRFVSSFFLPVMFFQVSFRVRLVAVNRSPSITIGGGTRKMFTKVREWHGLLLPSFCAL